MVYSKILLIRGEEEAAVEVDGGMDSCALTNISPPIPGASLLLVLLIVRITTLAMPPVVCYAPHLPFEPARHSLGDNREQTHVFVFCLIQHQNPAREKYKRDRAFIAASSRPSRRRAVK